MSNENSCAKTWLQNTAIFVLGLIFTLLIGEWLFPKLLNKVPFRLYGGIDNNLRVLAQYSKKSVIPNDYIAIFGDSNSVGVGDLYVDLTRNSKKWYPDYSPAHFLHRKLETDVVSFGFAGAGSFDGIWKGPKDQFEYIKSMGFNLKPPKSILIFFYEGNDLGNNIQYLNKFYKESDDFYELLNVVKLNEWLERHQKDFFKKNDIAFEKKFVFVNFLIQSIKNIYLENSKKIKPYISATAEEKLFSHVVINGTPYPLFNSQGSTIFPKNSVTHIVKSGEAFSVPSSSRIQIPEKSLNEAVVGGNRVALPGNLQAPPIVIGSKTGDIKGGQFKEMFKASHFIFEYSIRKLKELFPDSEAHIFYLPSTTSSYEITSHFTSINSDMGIPSIVNSDLLSKRHLEVCREILKTAKKLNVSFFDTTPFLREAGSKGYIHGPKDWAHFNESGYKALSDSISEFLLYPDRHYQNCAT